MLSRQLLYLGDHVPQDRRPRRQHDPVGVEVASGHQQLAVNPSLPPPAAAAAAVATALTVPVRVVPGGPAGRGVAEGVALGAHGGPEKVDAERVTDMIA